MVNPLDSLTNGVNSGIRLIAAIILLVLLLWFAITVFKVL